MSSASSSSQVRVPPNFLLNQNGLGNKIAAPTFFLTGSRNQREPAPLLHGPHSDTENGLRARRGPRPVRPNSATYKMEKGMIAFPRTRAFSVPVEHQQKIG